MKRGEFQPDGSFSPKQLPPRDTWLYDPYADGRMPTPVDSETGLVDIRELIKQVKQTIKPTYDWQSEKNDEHHLYWPNKWYDFETENDTDPQRFRNLSSNKLTTPRIFHNWLHIVTEPVEPPDEKIMKYYMEAHYAAEALSKSIENVRGLARRRWIEPDRRLRGEDYHYKEFFRIKDRISEVPPEIRLVDLSDYKPRSIDEISEISRRIKLNKSIGSATVRQVAARKRADSEDDSLTA